MNYDEQSAHTLAEDGELRAQLETMVMQQQPRVENFANNAVSQAITYQYGDPVESELTICPTFEGIKGRL